MDEFLGCDHIYSNSGESFQAKSSHFNSNPHDTIGKFVWERKIPTQTSHS